MSPQPKFYIWKSNLIAKRSWSKLKILSPHIKDQVPMSAHPHDTINQLGKYSQLISRAFHFNNVFHQKSVFRVSWDATREIISAISARPAGCPWKWHFQFTRRIDLVAKLIAPVSQTSVSLPRSWRVVHTAHTHLPVKYLVFPSSHLIRITLLCLSNVQLGRLLDLFNCWLDTTRIVLLPLNTGNSIMRLSFFCTLFAFYGLVAAQFDFWTNTNVVV